jgi:uncharacterized protein (TIGR04562 family)
LANVSGSRNDKATQLLSKWQFEWPIMEVLVSGRSALDLQRLRINTPEDAARFIQCYGYNLENDRDRRRLHAIIVEALNFLETVLMPEEYAAGMGPPPEIQHCQDARQLLLWMGSPDTTYELRRAWACVVLRVMHTILHADETQRAEHLEQAGEQIMRAMQQHLHVDDLGQTWFGYGPSAVELERVEWKRRKTRESVILKLLQKPGHVAETIYDLIGVRFVTRRLCDVLLLVKNLASEHVISFPNAHSSRSLNTLIDLNHFRAQIEAMKDMLAAGSLTPAQFESMLARMNFNRPQSGHGRAINPHSSTSYRSVQLTCRQLVRYQHPLSGWFERMRSLAARSEIPLDTRMALNDVTTMSERWIGEAPDEIQAFFPFEIQIMDIATYIHNQFGDAAHDRYKRSQIRAVRRRILGNLLRHLEAPES